MTTGGLRLDPNGESRLGEQSRELALEPGECIALISSGDVKTSSVDKNSRRFTAIIHQQLQKSLREDLTKECEYTCGV
jgi:hypothetical protein